MQKDPKQDRLPLSQKVHCSENEMNLGRQTIFSHHHDYRNTIKTEDE